VLPSVGDKKQISLSRGVVLCQSTFRLVSSTNILTHFAQSSKTVTVTKRFDVRLDNRPFLVFDFPALWRSNLIARVPESQSKTKNGWSASLASNSGISSHIVGTLS